MEQNNKRNRMLVIITTHPIQYQVPLWQKLAAENSIKFEVWYFTNFGTTESFDIQFGKSFSWDINLLEGYNYKFLKVNKEASPNLGFNGIKLAEDLKKRLQESKVSHVYINGYQVFAYWQALWAAKSLKLTTIFKGESNDLKPEIAWKWPLKKILLNYFFKRIDYFLFIGEANKRLYIKYGINEGKLFPGLYCIDNKRFAEANIKLQPHKSQIRKKWGIPQDSYCILFSGKFINKKRPIDIINSLKIINDPGIHLLFVGDGELYPTIKHHTNVVFDKENGIISTISSKEINVSITGFLNQSEIPEAYAVADCLVLPSDFRETWGLVANEAMASGIPPIISNQCGSAEDLANPISNKLVFQTGDINALSISIEWLKKNPISKTKIHEVIKNFCYNSTINSLEKIITNVEQN